MSKSCGNVQKVFVPAEKKGKPKPHLDTESLVVIQEKATSGLGISDIAAKKILHFIEKDGKNLSEYGLKIGVVKDGCSGKSYTMDLAPVQEALDNGDKLFTHLGATVIVEKTSYIFVIGSTLEYVETLLMSGFQLVNPNIKRTCSCGSSFAI